jgi:hypothetical protein
MRLYLAIKRTGMPFFAQHHLPVTVGSVAEFLALEATKAVVASSERFGDEWLVREENPDPLGEDSTVHTPA